MAKFNDVITADRKQINWLNTSFSKGEVFVDNTFQRRTVWVLKNKIRLIETILKGFPMPEIYLWAGKADPESGATTFSVVDGQQRLSAIRDYIAGTFKLDGKVLDKSTSPPSYQNKMFDELSKDEKQAIWSYNITTRTIPSDVKQDEIIEIFLRLNETDKSLNPQELRNAEFNGLFIKTVEELADLQFWETYKIFTAAVVRRMGDLQFISSLLMFLRSGIEEEVSQTSINNMYDTYNDNYPDKEKDSNAAQSILKVVESLFKKSEKVSKFFKSPVHLYPLFIVIYQRRALKRPIPLTQWVQRLEEFADEYRKKKPNALVTRYKLAATEGTLKRTNREDRVNFLRTWLTGT